MKKTTFKNFPINSIIDTEKISIEKKSVAKQTVTPFFKTLLLSIALFVTSLDSVWGQITVSTNTTSGNSTWTCPTGVTSITVECWGAGGRGGTRTTNGSGGGGGGGAYSRSIVNVTPGVTYLLTAGVGSSSTSAGGDSYFGNTTAGSPGGAIVLAKGGNSATDNSTTGATGGASASGIGTVKYNGGNGWTTTTTGVDKGAPLLVLMKMELMRHRHLEQLPRRVEEMVAREELEPKETEQVVCLLEEEEEEAIEQPVALGLAVQEGLVGLVLPILVLRPQFHGLKVLKQDTLTIKELAVVGHNLQ